MSFTLLYCSVTSCPNLYSPVLSFTLLYILALSCPVLYSFVLSYHALSCNFLCSPVLFLLSWPMTSIVSGPFLPVIIFIPSAIWLFFNDLTFFFRFSSLTTDCPMWRDTTARVELVWSVRWTDIDCIAVTDKCWDSCLHQLYWSDRGGIITPSDIWINWGLWYFFPGARLELR